MKREKSNLKSSSLQKLFEEKCRVTVLNFWGIAKNMQPNILYRGDKISNITMPERYRNCGIISKLINGGNPAYIQRNGLIKSIQAHINPVSETEKIFLAKSEFISFTEKKKIAKRYSSYDDVRKTFLSEELIECEEYFETRYIFSLNISDCIPLNREAGIYLLEYGCNPEKRKSDGLNVGIIEKQYEWGWYNCEICERNEKHKMYLIDSVKFLEFHKEYTLGADALANAKRDNEWLILPRDFSIRLGGYRSIIPVSEIWNAEHYFLKSEGKRKPDQFSLQGIILDDNEYNDWGCADSQM